LCRYRPFPEAEFAARAAEHPLLQTRPPDTELTTPLEALLRDGRASTHEALAAILLESADSEEAHRRALDLQAALPVAEDTGELRVAASEVAG
jgi:hypothetical protein